MAKLIVISPDSGDDSAAILSPITGRPIGTAKKGTLFKVASKGSDGYHVKYDDGSVTGARGGDGMTGVVAAFPKTELYDSITKKKILGYVNNGAVCTINDDSNVLMFNISVQTNQGYLSGYIPSKFIIRDGSFLTPEEREMYLPHEEESEEVEE